MTASPTPTEPNRSTTLFAALESHPYSTDYEYQSGLAAILGQPHITNSSTPQTNSATPSTRDLHLRARCFYFARKFPELTGPGGVDFDGYVAWREQQPAGSLTPLELTNPKPPPGSANASEFNTPEKRVAGVDPSVDVNGTPTKVGEAHPIEQADGLSPDEDHANAPSLSFQEVMDMIKEGKPIPGIKTIPNTVLVGQGTPSTDPLRKKPWERAVGEEDDIPSWQASQGPPVRDIFSMRKEAAP